MLPEIDGFLGSAIFAVVVALVVAAFQIAGVINMNLARLLLAAAWFVAVFGVTASLHNAPAKHLAIAASVTGIPLGVFLMILERWIDRTVRKREISEGKIPVVSIPRPWLRPYLKFFLVAWEEFKLSWGTGWGLARFLAVGLLALTVVLFALRYLFDISAKRTWLILGLSILFGFLAITIEFLRRAHSKTIWLQETAETDRKGIGAGIAVTKCEVELDLECTFPYAEFTVIISNGSLFPISIRQCDGCISFSNGRATEPQQLSGKLEMRPQLSAENCQRHASGVFALRQQLSSENVAFIRAGTQDGYFLFDKLNVKINGYRQDQNVAASRLSMDDVRPRLKGAYRPDASAIESKRQDHLSRIHFLGIVRGIAIQLYGPLGEGEDPMSKGAIERWESHALKHLTKAYGEDTADRVYKELTKREVMPSDFAPSQRQWFEDFFRRIDHLISKEKRAVDTTVY
jgi:hypothetical protein